MTEEQINDEIQILLGKYGAYGVHHPDSRRMRGKRGFPDWVIAGLRATLFAEVKTAEGTLSRDQRQSGRRLRRSGQAWVVWREADLDSGLIEAQIRSTMEDT